MDKALVKNPIITEKATNLSALNQYVFLVAKNATKSEVKKVVEAVYKVKIEKIAVINVKSKVRRLGRSIGTKPGYKKAVVTLKEGSKIDLTQS